MSPTNLRTSCRPSGRVAWRVTQTASVIGLQTLGRCCAKKTHGFNLRPALIILLGMPESSPKIRCPACQKAYALRPELLGKSVRCAACQSTFVMQPEIVVESDADDADVDSTRDAGREIDLDRPTARPVHAQNFPKPSGPRPGAEQGSGQLGPVRDFVLPGVVMLIAVLLRIWQIYTTHAYYDFSFAIAITANLIDVALGFIAGAVAYVVGAKIFDVDLEPIKISAIKVLSLTLIGGPVIFGASHILENPILNSVISMGMPLMFVAMMILLGLYCGHGLAGACLTGAFLVLSRIVPLGAVAAGLGTERAQQLLLGTSGFL